MMVKKISSPNCETCEVIQDFQHFPVGEVLYMIDSNNTKNYIENINLINYFVYDGYTQIFSHIVLQ